MAPAASSIVPPFSTVRLTTVPPIAAKVTPLLMVKPLSV